MRKIGLSEALFGLSLAGLAVLSVLYGNFGPLIDPLPWPTIWTTALGAILVVASAGLFFTQTIAASTMIVAGYAVAWAMVRIPPIVHAPLSVGSWYGFSEAISLLAGVGTIYALHRRRAGATALPRLAGDGALHAGRILFGGACLVYGLAHFAYADYSLPFVPTWFPARLPLVYVTGACHTAAGIGLIVGVLPRLAAALEAVMILLFGVLVWLPSFLPTPAPKWAGSLQNQWSETILTFLLAAVAWMITDSLASGRRTKNS